MSIVVTMDTVTVNRVARLLHVMARKDISTAIATINKGVKVDPYCMLAYMTLGSLELQR